MTIEDLNSINQMHQSALIIGACFLSVLVAVIFFQLGSQNKGGKK
jgi:hypothetical protein